MIDGEKVVNYELPETWIVFERDSGRFIDSDGSEFGIATSNWNGWSIYEEPLKDEAPEYIDIEVELNHHSDGLACRGLALSIIIGKYIERHDIRYFGTWYIVNDYAVESPVMEIGDKPTFGSHVRFICEDLLGGIPK